MKRKLILLSALFILAAMVQPGLSAQNVMNNPGFESWDNATTPTGWDIIEDITQENLIVRTGQYAARQEAGTSDLRQNVPVVGGLTYTISFWYLDNDANARSRIWSYWLNGTSTISTNTAELRPSTYSTDNPNWQEYTVTIDAPLNADGLRFEVRTYNDNQGGGYIYFDDFSVLAPQPALCTEFLTFSLADEIAPATIDTVANTIEIEVYAGTDLSTLVPTFTLCDFANAIDTNTQGIITSAYDVVDFSDTVVWLIIGEAPFQYYEIIVKESTVQKPSIVINEVDVDQPLTDEAEFIELMNNGQVAVNLNGWSLVLINGNNGLNYDTINLPDTTLLPGEYFVICGNAGNVPECDLVVSPSSNLIQNGAPDAIGLYDNQSKLADALSYEGSVPGYVEVSGAGLNDDGAFAGLSISRIPDGVDTDNNDADFRVVCFTPGMPNIIDTVPCVCAITDVMLDTVTDCDPLDGTYSYTIIVSYERPPLTGSISVNGNLFPITQSPQSITVTGVASTGFMESLEVFFTEASSCSWMMYEFIPAPFPCTECVDTLYLVSLGECNPQTNHYSATFTFEPLFEPNGDWVVSAAGVTDTFSTNITAMIYTVTLNGLPSDGQAVSASVFNTGNEGCVAVFDSAWTAPENCFIPPALVINEVDYEQPGTDYAEFVELKNSSNYTINLEGFMLELVNGSNNSVYKQITLPSYLLGPGEYFVICGSISNVPNCNMEVTPSSNLIQNGAPDAMALYDPYGTMIDALSYEGDVPGYVENSGSALLDNNTPSNGLSRYPDGKDTDDNNADFLYKCITPGEANTYLNGYCGPFHTATLEVYYENAAQSPMPDVEVTAVGGSHAPRTLTSDAAGVVVFDSLQDANYTFEVDPITYTWGWGGVNSLDALFVQLHSVGLITLQEPYVNVADVNLSTVINATDALQIAQRFAGLLSGFDAGDWYPSDVQIDMTFGTNSSVNAQIGLLTIGDVNGSHTPISGLKASETSLACQGHLMLEEEMQIPVSVAEAVELGAVSIVMQLPDGMEVTAITMADGQSPVFNVEDGVLKLSWFSMEAMQLNPGDILMNLQLRSSIDKAPQGFALLPGTVFGNAAAEKVSLNALLMPEISESIAAISSFPNPAANEMQIHFSLPEAGNITIEMTDVLGASVQILTREWRTAGNHTQSVNLSPLSEGTYFLQLRGEGFQAVHKVLVVR